MKTGENWSCPYCGQAQVIADERRHIHFDRLRVENWVEGPGAYRLEALVCANTKCRKLSAEFAIQCRKDLPNGHYLNLRTFQFWRLLPSSFAKPLPACIPEPLRRDYEEACAIRDLSPKASATLIRRCIQGVIRDFCGITEKRLIDEIRRLSQQVNNGQAPAGVQADTVDAIDYVRQIGNIGAHMEADINAIIDVDSDEAQTLIELAELLFEEWYMAREQRTQRLENLRIVAEGKKEHQQQKQLAPPAGNTNNL